MKLGDVCLLFLCLTPLHITVLVGHKESLHLGEDLSAILVFGATLLCIMYTQHNKYASIWHCIVEPQDTHRIIHYRLVQEQLEW